MLQTSTIEGSMTALDETLMPPPSRQRVLKRKSQELEAALPVSPEHDDYYYSSTFIFGVIFTP